MTKNKIKPKVLIRNDHISIGVKHVILLCSNCAHDHISQNLCLENGICKCNNGNAKDLGHYEGSSEAFKDLLLQFDVVEER